MTDSIMIALLPVTSHWSQLTIPHLTVVYAGKVQDHKLGDFNELAKDASSMAALARPITLEVTGLEIFGGGEDEKVDVLTLRPNTQLVSMRNFFERWNQSEYKEYKPHVTIGPTPSGLSVWPKLVSFNRLLLGWGDQYLTFWLK